MPGSLIIRPIEAHFLDGDEAFDRMNPYCDLRLGNKYVKTEVCKHGGANPSWHHPLVIPVKEEQDKCTLEIKDEQLLADQKGSAGSCVIDLIELRREGNLRKWYSLTKNGQCEGDILIEASFLPELPPFFGNKSTPPASKEAEHPKLLTEELSKSPQPCDGRQAQRKMSDCRPQGRGWNLYVPEEDDEDFEELTLQKSKSMADVDSDNFDGKIERRKSFWEKLLHI